MMEVPEVSDLTINITKATRGIRDQTTVSEIRETRVETITAEDLETTHRIPTAIQTADSEIILQAIPIRIAEVLEIILPTITVIRTAAASETAPRAALHSHNRHLLSQQEAQEADLDKTIINKKTNS
jgi:hypothetical protein